MNTQFSIKSSYRHDEVVVRLQGPITEESIVALCDEINVAIDYYYYPRFILQIDSPGGSTTALDYYLQQLQYWRQRQIGIVTEALTCAYSAAAVMLSLGDIGHRRAYSTSKLLYHNPRVVTEGGAMDARTLIDAYHQLTTVNETMVDHLANHVYEKKILTEVVSQTPLQFRWKKILTMRTDLAAPFQSNPADLFIEVDCGEREHLDLDQIKLAYQALHHRDLIISARQALDMLLIDAIIDAK